MGCLCSYRPNSDTSVLPPPARSLPIDLVVRPELFIKENQSKFAETYSVQRLLGRGLYTAVYECIHSRTRQTRAVKIVYKDRVDRDILEAGDILREVEIHKTLDHPNIVRLLEFFEDSRHYYFVQELCAAGELFDVIIARQKLSERQSARYMQQLASAVAYLHSRGVIHRDIKPENILLTEEGEIKLGDFDTAVHMDVAKQVQGSVGTAFYMAPEVVRKGTYNEKCDIWSMGVVMYILLSGHPPFDGVNTREVRRQVAAGKYELDGPLWEGISDSAKDLIRKQLHPKPHMRISAQDVYLHPWIQERTSHVCDADRSLVFRSLRQFNSSTKLKEAVNTFLCTHILSENELRRLTDMFHEYDQDGDGVLSAQDLLRQFEVMMPKDSAREEVERVMKEVDTDSNGFIEYTEFLKATIDKRQLLSESNLQLAFSTFDKFGTGYITLEELKEWLMNGSHLEDAHWSALLAQAGLQDSALVDLKGFEHLLLTSLPTEGDDGQSQ